MFEKEPVLILDVLKYGIAAAASFGVAVKPEQFAAIMGLATAVLALLTAYTRSRVSPL